MQLFGPPPDSKPGGWDTCSLLSFARQWMYCTIFSGLFSILRALLNNVKL